MADGNNNITQWQWAKVIIAVIGVKRERLLIFYVEKSSMQEKGRGPSYPILCIITGCGGGDWPPLLALASGLHRRGHDLMVVCDTTAEKSVQATGMVTLCLPQSLDLAHVFEPAIARLLSRKEKLILGGENPLEVWSKSCIDYVKIALNDWCPSLVLTSLFGVGLGRMLSKKFVKPWCFLNPSFSFSHSLRHPRKEDFSEMGVQMYRHWLLPLAKTANLVLHATDPEFDYCPKVLPAHHKYVGPMFWELPGNDLALLKKPGPPWVLMALSTSPQPADLTIVRTALKALRSKDFRILITLAPGHDKDDLGCTSANVHVTGYIAHSRVLPHCRLVISHAGHGIVMKAMVHGVPMVLVPWGRDQPGVAARAERLGTAVVVPRSECSVSTLNEAVKKIINDPKYMHRSQKVADRLRNMDGVTCAVDYVEKFLRNR